MAEDLAAFARALEEVPELRAVLGTRRSTLRRRPTLLDQLTEGGDDLVRNFVRLVAEKAAQASSSR